MRMGTLQPRCLFLLWLAVLVILVLANGASVMSPGAQPRGYARLLAKEGIASSGQPGLVGDCLMRQAMLRGPEGIPGEQFEVLRSFCRQAAAMESPRAMGGGELASLDGEAPDAVAP